MAMLGAECSGCCGGDWYCCATAPSPCGPSDFISSAIVTVSTGSDYIHETKLSRSSSCPVGNGFQQQQFHLKSIAIIPSSHYAGTFSLSKLSGQSFGYAYPADAAGCSSSITLELQRSVLSEYAYLGRLRLDYRSYAWNKWAASYPPETKSLSQMQCISNSPFSECGSLPFEQYVSQLYPHTIYQSLPAWHFSVPRCPGQFSYTYTGNFFPLLAGMEDVSQSGSTAYTIAVTLNHEQP